MATQAETEAKIRRLEDIEAIRQLQHKYFRCIDCKLFDELQDCFADNVKTDYDGWIAANGKAALMKGFREGPVANVKQITVHDAHNPEIELTSDTTAKGIWRFSDYLIYVDTGKGVRGAGIHYDEYVKVNGKWMITLASFKRVFEESFDRKADKSLKLNKAAEYPLKFPAK